MSHLESFSFSLLIQDHQIIDRKRKRVGKPRNFAIVDDTGELYDGINTISWDLNPAERQMIKKYGLEYPKGTVEFRRFVHPNLAYSPYGSKYAVLHALSDRIMDQRKHYMDQAIKLQKEGIRVPPPPMDVDEQPIFDEPTVYRKVGPKKPIEVLNLETRMVLPPFTGQYTILGVEEIRGYGRKMVGLTDYGNKMPTSRKD